MRLAVISSHPIQYYAPWFRQIASYGGLELKVFYLWDFGVAQRHDPGFDTTLQWDIPLLDGYDSEFVPNVSSRPGTDHFWGLRNPELVERVHTWKPDALLLIGYKYASMLELIFRCHGVPLIFRGDSHRLAGEGPGMSTGIKRMAIAALFSKFSAFLPVGKANAAYFSQHGVPANKLFVSPHAVDNSRFSSTSSGNDWKIAHDIPESARVVLFAGKFEEKKCPLLLLKAFAAATLDRVHLVFVGDGALGPQLQKEASWLKKPVHFVPFQNQSEMPSVYAAADLVVLPSKGNGETWGLSINEAMAASKPALVSSHVGCGPDLVEHGKTGWIFPAGDGEALSNCLEDAFRDEKRLKAMGESAQQRVLSDFSYAKSTQGLLKALDYVRAAK